MEKKEKDNEYVDFVVTARKYKTTLTAKYKNRKMWHKPFVGDVISHLPGKKSFLRPDHRAQWRFGSDDIFYGEPENWPQPPE